MANAKELQDRYDAAARELEGNCMYFGFSPTPMPSGGATANCKRKSRRSKRRPISKASPSCLRSGCFRPGPETELHRLRRSAAELRGDETS